MLNIPGSTYREVFSVLATHPELTDIERHYASILAEDMANVDRWKEDDEDRPYPSVRYEARHPVSDTRVFCPHGTPIHFVVRPYTTTNSMNVGVESSD